MSTEAELKELSFPEFWDSRYASEQKPSSAEDGTAVIDSFEWFRDFSKLRFFFEKSLPKVEDRPLILHLGCGNSVCPIAVQPRYLCLYFSYSDM